MSLHCSVTHPGNNTIGLLGKKKGRIQNWKPLKIILYKSKGVYCEHSSWIAVFLQSSLQILGIQKCPFQSEITLEAIVRELVDFF